MPRLTEQQINNIYVRCNSVPLDQLLELCLDPESGVTVEGLRAVKFAKIDLLEKQYNEAIVFQQRITELEQYDSRYI